MSLRQIRDSYFTCGSLKGRHAAECEDSGWPAFKDSYVLCHLSSKSHWYDSSRTNWEDMSRLWRLEILFKNVYGLTNWGRSLWYYRFDFFARPHFMPCLSQCQSDSAITRTCWAHDQGAQPVENEIRSGGATLAAGSGVSERNLQRHGRWASVTAKNIYVKDSLASRLEVSKALSL